MEKQVYFAPLADVKLLSGENIICASGSGSNEDFGKGSSYDF